MRFLKLMAITLMLAGCTQTAPDQQGGTTTGGTTPSTRAVSIKAEPAPTSAEKGVSEALLVDVSQDGKPVENAKVSAKSSMPGMNMTGPDLQGTQTAPGKYRLPGDLMKGEWQFDVRVDLPAGGTHTETIKTEVK